MNRLTQIKMQQQMNDKELELGLAGGASWHDQYKDSAYVYCGGFPFDLTDGDIIAVMSQYGEIVDMNLVRDKATGKSKGFAFIAYEDQRSTVLAVDNLNGFELLGRQLKVDHVQGYRKEKAKEDEAEREEQEKRLKAAEVVRAWNQPGFKASKDPTYSSVVGLEQQKADRKIQKKKEKAELKLVMKAEKKAAKKADKKAAKKAAKKSGNETKSSPPERLEGRRGVHGGDDGGRDRRRSRSPENRDRRRSRSPPRRRERSRSRERRDRRRDSRSRSRGRR